MWKELALYCLITREIRLISQQSRGYPIRQLGFKADGKRETGIICDLLAPSSQRTI